MKSSESIKELTTALSKAQSIMHPAKKTAENPFFKSTYADLATIWEVCRKPLSENGLAIIQTTELSERGVILETILAHTSGEWITSQLPVTPVKNDPQGLGSALTYARRYALAAIIGATAEDEDDDAEKAMGRETQKPAKEKGQPVAKPVQDSTEYKPSPVAEQTSGNLPEGENPEFKDGVDLINFALKNGWKMVDIKKALGIEKPKDIKNVDVAFAVLFGTKK